VFHWEWPCHFEALGVCGKDTEGRFGTTRTIWFNAEAMALRSAHEGCIKWIAVHPTKSEGYTLWWNGGTIREMIREEVLYNHESVHITLQWLPEEAAILIDSNNDYQKKLDTARRVEVFRKKRHKLAWTFLNTMNNVHHCHTLHNDMSPDNVLLHFPPNSLDKGELGHGWEFQWFKGIPLHPRESWGEE
jgi:hypothetical protein